MDEQGERETGHRSGSEPDVSLDVLPLHSTNLLTVLDEEGIIQYESPSIERIYGYDPSDLVGDQVAEYFHPDDRERVLAAYRSIVASDGYTERAVEYRHERADETYLWVESIASTNPTPNGHYVVNTRDISERKERERKLEETNERLQNFASIVSHDLRNPLGVAQGRLELARNDCENGHLDGVAEAHDQMETLITELLALAQAGQQVAETERVVLGDLASDCWGSVSTGEATLVVETDRAICADPGRLRQLLENLVRNSMEHGSTSSRPHADDSVEHSGDPVTVIVGEVENGFYVEDDGPGIPASERELVFEVGHSETLDGTGLGLNIVEQIVEAHGWEISLLDGVEGGARFEISGVEFVS